MKRAWFGGVALLLAASLVCGPASATPDKTIEAVQPTAPPVMSPVVFRAAVEAAIRARLPKARIVEKAVDELTVYPLGGDANPEQLFLGNVYGLYRNDPGGGDFFIERFVRTLLKSTTSTEPAATADKYVILIRPESFVNDPRLTGITAEHALVWRPFAGGLVEIMEIDGGDSFRTAGNKEVTALFGDVDRAWSGALASSAHRLGDITVQQLDQHLWSVTSSNDMADSLMLIPNGLARSDLPLKGAPVVVALQRNILIVADGHDEAQVASLRRWMKRLAEDPETASDQTLMSTEIFVRRDGRWSLLEGQ